MVELKKKIFRFLFYNYGKRFTFTKIKKNVGEPYRQRLYYWIRYFRRKDWIRREMYYNLKKKNFKYRYYFNPKIRKKINIDYYKKAGWIEDDNS